MKKFLFLAFAAITIPTAASAETYWLILKAGADVPFSESIPTNSLEECEAAIAKLSMRNSWSHSKPMSTSAICLKGK